jgi:hypothetical protein
MTRLDAILDALPGPLRALADRHEADRRASLVAEAASARAALAALSDDEPQRLLAIAAKLRGEAEALRRKADAAAEAADAAHARYVAANSALSDRRRRLRQASVPSFELAEARAQLDAGEARICARWASSTSSDQAARTALFRTLLPLRRDVLDSLRDGVRDLPERPLRELVAETVAAAEHAAALAAAAHEDALRAAEKQAELRRVYG